jgi:hypothetical protein
MGDPEISIDSLFHHALLLSFLLIAVIEQQCGTPLVSGELSDNVHSHPGGLLYHSTAPHLL